MHGFNRSTQSGRKDGEPLRGSVASPGPCLWAAKRSFRTADSLAIKEAASGPRHAANAILCERLLFVAEDLLHLRRRPQVWWQRAAGAQDFDGVVHLAM